MSACEPVLQSAPDQPAAPVAEPRGRDRARGRAHRVSDGLELRVRLARRRQGRARARAALRGIERDHDFTLACRDLSDIATYARVENWAYRLLKALTPGPYTFVLRATHAAAEAPAGSEEALDRHSRARSHDRAGAARRARRAAHELDAAVAARYVAADGARRHPRSARAPGRRDHRRRRLRHRAHVGARPERRRRRGRAQRARATSPHSEADRERATTYNAAMFGMDPTRSSL